MNRVITIHQALSELKLLDKKINDAVKKPFIDCILMQNSHIKNKTETDIKANYQSVTTMIKNYSELKYKISLSNSVTNVLIAGNTYTVLEAITLKDTIRHSKMLLSELINQNNYNKNLMKSNAESIKNSVTKAIIGVQNNENMLKSLYDLFEQKEGYLLIDPLNLESKIIELNEEIDNFLSNVDGALSTSNAITTIEI